MTTKASHRKRWKRIEVQVAGKLSEIFSDAGHAPVWRIPILGRTGPDITYNDVGLIVDVKSRREVPKSSLAMKGQILYMGNMNGFRLSDMSELDTLTPKAAEPSILVSAWLTHMNDWRVKYLPSGIACVIVHRPKMPSGESTVIIYSTERNTLWNRITASSSPAPTPSRTPATISAPN